MNAFIYSQGPALESATCWGNITHSFVRTRKQITTDNEMTMPSSLLASEKQWSVSWGRFTPRCFGLIPWCELMQAEWAAVIYADCWGLFFQWTSWISLSNRTTSTFAMLGVFRPPGSGWKWFTDNSCQHLHLATDFGGSFWLFSSTGAGNIGLRWSRVYWAKAIWCRVDSNLGYKQESQHLLFICSYWQRLLVSYQTYPECTTMSTSSFPCPRGQLDDRRVEWKSQGWLWSSFEAHMDFAYLVWVWKIHGRYMAMCWA